MKAHWRTVSGKGRSSVWPVFEFSTALTIGLALLLLPYQSYVKEWHDPFLAPWNRLLMEWRRGENDFVDELRLSDLLRGAVPAGAEGRMSEEERKQWETSADEELEVLYLFVLDTSGSINRPQQAPRWFAPALDRIRKAWPAAEPLALTDSPDSYRLAQVLLSDLLLGIAPKKNNHHTNENERFAVWAMGDSARPVYPATTQFPYSSELTRDAVRAAIPATLQNQGGEGNTNFVAVVHAFREFYPEFFDKRLFKDNRVAVVTILSDFVHDTDGLPRLLRLDEEWAQVERDIQNQSHIYVVANLIVVTPTGSIDETVRPSHRQISRTYLRSFSPSKFSLVGVSADVHKHMLYPPMQAPRPIRFVWERHAFMNSVVLSLDHREDRNDTTVGDLTIALPSSINNIDQPPLVMRWELLTHDEPTTGERDIERVGWVTTGGDVFSGEQMVLNQRMRLALEGDPAALEGRRVVAQFTNGSDRRIYNVDVEVERVMPILYASLVAFVEILLIISLLLLFLRLPWIRKVLDGPSRLMVRWWAKVRRGTGAFRPRVDPRWLEGIWVSNGELLTLHGNGNFTRSPHDHDTEMARGLYEFVASSHVLRFSVRDAGAGATVFNPPQIEEREVAELHHHTMLLVCPATNRDIWYEKRVEPV